MINSQDTSAEYNKAQKHTQQQTGTTASIEKQSFNALCGTKQHVLRHTHLLLCDEMLNDDVGHAVSESITIVIQAMNSAEYDLIGSDRAVIATESYETRCAL
jgi:hypothetical protein